MEHYLFIDQASTGPALIHGCLHSVNPNASQLQRWRSCSGSRVITGGSYGGSEVCVRLESIFISIKR
jgi:hypothetical protein